MINWICSFIIGSTVFLLASSICSRLGVDGSIITPAITLTIWLCSGFLMNASKEEPTSLDPEVIPSTEVNEPTQSARPVVSVNSTDIESSSLHNAVLELTKQLRSKEKDLDSLHAKITEREFRRSLSRLASINETLDFTIKLVEEGRLSPTDAVEQLRVEIASAISDFGLDFYPITPGVAVSSLPLGSFVIVKAFGDAPAGMAGTVKDVICQGLCVSDEKGKLHFISPSKITVYKL